MRRRQLGIAALVLSTLLWLGVFVVPLFEGPVGTKAAVAGSLYAVSTVLFLLSGWLLGRDTMDHLRGWTRRRVAALRDRSS